MGDEMRPYQQKRAKRRKRCIKEMLVNEVSLSHRIVTLGNLFESDVDVQSIHIVFF